MLAIFSDKGLAEQQQVWSMVPNLGVTIPQHSQNDRWKSSSLIRQQESIWSTPTDSPTFWQCTQSEIQICISCLPLKLPQNEAVWQGKSYHSSVELLIAQVKTKALTWGKGPHVLTCFEFGSQTKKIGNHWVRLTAAIINLRMQTTAHTTAPAECNFQISWFTSNKL